MPRYSKKSYSGRNRATKRRGRMSRKPRKRRGKGLTARVKRLSKEVKKVRDIANAVIGHVIYRQRENVSSTVLENASIVSSINLCDINFIRNSLAALPFFDPATPGTLVEANGNTGTFQNDFLCKFSMSFTARNNYIVPVKVRLYLCLPKSNTGLSPSTAYANGLVDQGSALLGSALIYPTDSLQLGLLWKIIWSKRITLDPGHECGKRWGAKPFHYDPSFDDTEAKTFYVPYCGASMMWRIEGVVGHDTVTAEQGHLPAGIDMTWDRVMKVDYGAGIDLQRNIVVDNSDDFTNLGVISNKPLAGNQSFQTGAGF